MPQALNSSERPYNVSAVYFLPLFGRIIGRNYFCKVDQFLLMCRNAIILQKCQFSAEMKIICRKSLFLSPNQVVLGWLHEVIYKIKCNFILQRHDYSAENPNICRKALYLQKLSISAEIFCFCNYSAETEISVIFSHRNWFLCFGKKYVPVVH